MNRILATASFAVIALSLAACGGSGGTGKPPELRVFHASPDAPPVNVIVNGTVVAADVDYTIGSGFVQVPRTTQVQIEAILPGDDSIVIDEILTLDRRTEYTAIAVGDVAAPISALVVANPSNVAIPAGNFRAQVVHVAPDAPDVDVYVTTFDADLATSVPVNQAVEPFGPLAYQASTARVDVPEGDYQIRVTVAGDPAAIVYDSGEITLAAGVDLLIAAVENTGPGTTPIQLVTLDGAGSSDLLDVATPAAAYAVHASPDAGNVDILADADATPADDAIPLAVDVPFTASCAVEAIPAPASYAINITATGDPTPVLSFPVTVEKADEATAIVTGFALSTPVLQQIELVSNTRSVITETKLRVTHASPSTDNVDIYLLEDGTDFNDPDVGPTFGDVPFTFDTGIQSVAPGIYDIYVTPAGNKGVIAIEVQDFPLTGGQVLEAIARDPETDGSEGPLPQLIVVDYATIGACPT